MIVEKVSLEQLIQECSSEDQRRMMIARIKFGMAITLADVINTLILDVQSLLSRKGASLRHEDKRSFKLLTNFLASAKAQSQKISDPLYQIGGSPFEDADFLYELLMTVVAHVGSNDALHASLLSKIKKSYKKKIHGLLPYD